MGHTYDYGTGHIPWWYPAKWYPWRLPGRPLDLPDSPRDEPLPPHYRGVCGGIQWLSFDR